MPKVSKIAPPKKSIDFKPVYRCKKCKKEFTESQRAKAFSRGSSPLWQGDGKFFPVCKDCVDELYNHYREVFGSEEKALRRVCLHFDVYWSPEIYALLGDTSSSRPRFRAYMEKANLLKYSGKTFDDTLDEEELKFKKVKEGSATEDDVIDSVPSGALNFGGSGESEDELKVRLGITPADEAFWGYGYPAYSYANLKSLYKRLTKDNHNLTVEQQVLYKQLCITDLRISEANQNNEKIDSLQSSMGNIMTKLGISPNQTKESDLAETNTFGVLIKKYEERKPIDECKNKNQLVWYITTYFLGHLCKMLKIHNRYAHMYEEEMNRYRVERPEYAGEDDEAIFESVFAEALKTAPSDKDGGDADDVDTD